MKLSIDQIKVVNDRLRAFDPGWVKSKEQFGNKPAQKYLDHQTITQILNYATYGITEWDFEITEQWREEVHKKDKQSQQWVFDGYVYHAKGELRIHGLGKRTQFGKKVAAGGATGQDMSYQSAASNALSKCASLFGIGESLYVPQHQIISQGFTYDETMRLLGHTFVAPQTVAPQMVVPQMVAQGASLNPMQQVQQEVDQLFATPQQQMPPQQTPQNEFVDPIANQLPTAFGAPQQQQAQANWEPTTATWTPPTDTGFATGATAPTASDVQFMQENNVPFGNAQTQPQMSQQQQTPQPVQPNNQPTEVMGAPIIVNNQPTNVQQEPTVVQGSDEQQKFLQQITLYNQHKTRLGYTEDTQMEPYLRDFFKDENASTKNLNMETIVGFNEYMLTIQV